MPSPPVTTPQTTHAELLAASHPASREVLEAAIRTYGFEAYEAALLDVARRAIVIEPSRPKGELPVGASKMGGAPDLPSGFEHPNSDGALWMFIGQLDLAELAPHQAFLPRSGLLSFFSSSPNYDGDPVRVLHFSVDASLHRYVYAEPIFSDDCFDAPLREAACTFVSRVSIPYLWQDDGILPESAAGLIELDRHRYHDESRDPMERYEAMRSSLMGSDTSELLCINGYVFTQHDSPEEAVCFREEDPRERIVLLSVTDQMPGGFNPCAGQLSFVIRKSDLKAGRFDAVSGTVEAS